MESWYKRKKARKPDFLALYIDKKYKGESEWKETDQKEE